MLDHLDDPTPFRPGADFRDRVRSRGRWLRLRRGLAGAMAGVLLLGGVAGAGALYVDGRDDAIDRVEVFTVPSQDGATNVLLVGTDGAVPLDRGELEARADTMALVRIGADGSLSALSLPRDLWVPHRSARLNQSFADGGPQQLVSDITELTGVPVDHYVQLTFEGFAGLVDEAGGVRVRVHSRARDEASGLRLEPSECATLDGATALALLRSRRIEVQEHPAGPGWTLDPSGDLGRIERGRVLMQAALVGLRQQDPGVTDPLALDRLSRILADHATVDDELSLSRMMDLGTAVLDADPPTLAGETLPTTDRVIDGASVLVPTSDAAFVYARYGGPPADPDQPPSEDTLLGVGAVQPVGPCAAG